MVVYMTRYRCMTMYKLYNSIMGDNDYELEHLLKNKKPSFDIDQILPIGLTPLQLAVKLENVIIAKLLIKHGANLGLRTDNGDTYLHLAAMTGNVELVKLFCYNISVDDNNCDGFDSLQIAEMFFKYNVVLFLVENFIHIDNQNYALSHFLYNAVKNRDLAAVRLMLSHGADPNYLIAHRNTAFQMHFGYFSSCEVLDLFLDYGAEIHMKDEAGSNALYYAIFQSESDEVVERLLLMNMDPNEPAEDGITVLHSLFELADDMHSEQLVFNKLRLLVNYGADIHAIGLGGETTLFYAVARRHYEAVRYLIDLGANVNGYGNCIPVIEAIQNNDYEMVELLIHSGAAINFETDIARRKFYSVISCIRDDHYRTAIVKLLVETRSNLLPFLGQHYNREALFNF